MESSPCAARHTFVAEGQGDLQGTQQETEHIAHVLDTQVPGHGVNRSFRLKRGQMYTYSQEKVGLPYLYGKHSVMEDGVSTSLGGLEKGIKQPNQGRLGSEVEASLHMRCGRSNQLQENRLHPAASAGGLPAHQTTPGEHTVGTQ